MKRQRADDFADRKSRDLRDLAYAYKDIAKAAAAQKLELTGADVWLDQRPGPTDNVTFPIPARPQVFTLKDGEVSDSISVPQGVVVAQLKEIKAPQPIPFEKVKDQVQMDFRIEQAKVLARADAEELLKIAKEKNGLDAAAKERKLAVKESGWFSRKAPDKEIKPVQPQDLGRILELQESKPLPDSPVEMAGGYLVCQLAGRTPADQPDDKVRTDTSGELLLEKQNTLWMAWLQDQQKRVKIEVYKDKYGANKTTPDEDW